VTKRFIISRHLTNTTWANS